MPNRGQGNNSSALFGAPPPTSSLSSLITNSAMMNNNNLLLMQQQQQQQQQVGNKDPATSYNNNNNNNNNNIESETSNDNEDSQQGGKFASIACTSCRKLHRKCDKTLPCCAYCVKTGKQCVYPSPRRGKQFQQQKKANQSSSDAHSQLFNNPSVESMEGPSLTIPTSSFKHISSTSSIDSQSSTSSSNDASPIHYTPYDTGKTQHELNYKYVATQSLDIYYSVLCYGYPLIERERLQSLIDGGKQKKNGQNTPLFVWQSKLDQEKDYGLLYTMQALCLQQLGHKDISSQLFLKGKQIVGKFFDEVDTLNIPIAMKFMAEYLLGSGEKKKARVLTSTIRTNIAPYLKGSGLINPNNMDKDFGWIDKEPRLFPSVLLESQLKYLEFFLTEEESPQTFIFEELEILGHNKMKLDLSKVGPTCKNLNEENKQKLLAIIKTYECFTDLVFNTLAKKDALVYLIAQLTNKQVHLEILLNCSPQIMDIGEMLKISYQIIELTKNNFFTYIPIFSTKAIVLACSVRLKYNNQGLNPHGFIDFRDDLRALRVLANRFTLIQKEHAQLIKTIESVLYTQSLTQSHKDIPFGGQPSFTSEENPFQALLNNPSSSFSPEAAISDILPPNGYYDDFLDHEHDIGLYSQGDLFASHLLDTFYENNVYETRYRRMMEDVMEGSERFSISIQNMIKQQQAQQLPDALQRAEGLKKLRLDLANQMIDIAKQHNDIPSVIEAELFRRQVIAANVNTQQAIQLQQNIRDNHQQFSQFLETDSNFMDEYPFEM
ncbi:predicted protein [Naegleria gruberi]|uniref:Predicted protein n=1 Tax=Naegleria gruberi TaxID=5762 RepID=D2VYW7_NAEGR|nr:uncharacterized protein NAEGRDRAFT_81761 [Naegleria gruberi]EFC37985.1 predicted protein [Naegleria gruberi]|eukprot:XP_002670729.1 predicted protein [Naegleria gruberi strain NEG-M]